LNNIREKLPEYVVTLENITATINTQIDHEFGFTRRYGIGEEFLLDSLELNI
jgi:hypothetical protein